MLNLNGWKVWMFENLIEGPHFGIPKFCHIIIFCYIYLSWKLHVSSLSRKKTLLLAVPFEEDLPIVVPQSFVKFYLLFTFVYPKYFMCLAQTIKKFKF